MFASAPANAGASAALDGSSPVPPATSRFVADMTVVTLGGGLKMKQKITGRMADALVELYHPLLRPQALSRTTAARAPI